jgi:phosphatidate cytidylyltransferase
MVEPAPERSSRKRGPSRAEFDATVHDIEAQVRATNEKINKRSGRPLFLAIVVGLTLGGALLVSLIFVKELFMIFAGVLIALVAFEFASALRSAGHNVPRIPVVLAAIAIIPASFWAINPEAGLTRDAGHWLATLAGIAFVVLWRLVAVALPSKRIAPTSLITDLSAAVFVISYVVFLPSFFVLMTAKDGGEWWTLASLIVVVSVDVGAYASGVLFGKHPMAPRISPKKTWEGFAGSVIVAITAGVLLAIFMLHVPWGVGIILGVTMVFTATIGDLTESLIKRDLGIKDISTWLPGHGGFLDRLDSALPSAAAAYALFLIFS